MNNYTSIMGKPGKSKNAPAPTRGRGRGRGRGGNAARGGRGGRPARASERSDEIPSSAIDQSPQDDDGELGACMQATADGQKTRQTFPALDRVKNPGQRTAAKRRNLTRRRTARRAMRRRSTSMSRSPCRSPCGTLTIAIHADVQGRSCRAKAWSRRCGSANDSEG